jgi:hypothetical protein
MATPAVEQRAAATLLLADIGSLSLSHPRGGRISFAAEVAISAASLMP